MNATKTVFRKYVDGEIIALFPDEPYDRLGVYCMSYMHVGQHGGADYDGVVRDTSPASHEEYAELEAELRRLGYELDVRHRKAVAS